MPPESRQFASALLRWWWLLILATTVAATMSYRSGQQLPREYQSMTTLGVGQFLRSTDPRAGDLVASQQLAQNYALAVRHQPILQATLDGLGLSWPWQALAANVFAAAPEGTALIQISVRDYDPRRAKIIADEIARQLILQSPTAQEDGQYQERREFVLQQMTSLENRIAQAEKDIKKLDSQLAQESSARAIQDIQNQMQTRQRQIDGWQNTYAQLLAFFQGSRVNYLTVIEPASVLTTPIGPNIRLNVIVAACIGFILAALAAIVIEYLDDTIKTDKEVGRLLQLVPLGSLARIRQINQPSDHLVTILQPSSSIAEAVRTLRANVQFSIANNLKTALLVSSALPGEGKTTVAANLAVSLAQSGKRVILVDADLRKPTVHEVFNISAATGLSTLLLDERLSPAEALAETSIAGLSILSSGPVPSDFAELISSQLMRRRLGEIKEMADVLIIDSPPVLPVTDASVLSTLCDGVILVVDSRRTRREAVKVAAQNLSQVGAKIVGVVLNNLQTRQYEYGRYYSRTRRKETESDPRVASSTYAD